MFFYSRSELQEEITLSYIIPHHSMHGVTICMTKAHEPSSSGDEEERGKWGGRSKVCFDRLLQEGIIALRKTMRNPTVTSVKNLSPGDYYGNNNQAATSTTTSTVI